MSQIIREDKLPYRTGMPPLESGDVLDADEYWRRCAALPHKVKAERIHGRVYLMNSLRAVRHGNPHFLLAQWLGTYAMHDPSLIGSDNATIRPVADHDPQPDLCRVRSGGPSHCDDDGCIIGPPEMIVEVAGASASDDVGEKCDVFEAAGVAEYLVFETR